MIKLLLLLLLVASMKVEAQSYQFPVDTLIKTGSLKRRINVLILPDGYTINELKKFKNDALAFINYMLDSPPFNTYKPYFNFFTVNVPSNESGITHPGIALDEGATPKEPIAVRDTYFGTTFDHNYVHRSVTMTKVSNFTNVVATNFPAYDIVFMIANSAYYGGSGGIPATFTLHNTAYKIGLHEMGHSFVGLADEYWPGYGREAINMTLEHRTDRVRWKNWLDVEGIGIYSHDIGASWNKPSVNACRMEVLDKLYCAVCREGTVEKILATISPIEKQFPADSSILLTQDSTTFKLDLLKPLPNTLQIEWKLDGKSISTQEQIKLSALNMPNKTAKLVATIYDSTYLSRNISRKMTPYFVEWQLSRGDLFRIVALKTSVCAGDSVTLTSIGCTGDVHWSNNRQGNTITIKPASSTTYSAICNNSAVNKKDSVNLFVTPIPIAVASNKGPYAENQTIELFGSGGNTYEWKGTNNFTSTQQNPTIPKARINNSGVYTLTVRINNCQNTTTTIVNVTPLISISEITPSTVCQNGQISLTFTANRQLGTNNSTIIQLSNSQGNNFENLPTSIQDNILRATIPLTTNIGKGYKVRVVTTNPESQSAESPTILNVRPFPTARFEDSLATINQYRSFDLAIYITGDPPYKFKLSDGHSFEATDSPITIKLSPNQTTQYRLTSISNVCGEGTPATNTFKIIVIPVLGLEMSPNDMQVEVYPNPAENSISINIKKASNDKASIELVNPQGQQLFYQETKEVKTTIDLQGVAAGSYFLIVQQGDKIISKKIVKY